MTLDVDVTHRVGTFDLRARFRVGPGITVAFGPSGSGKTTLLRLLAGLDRPHGGRIVLNDRTIADASRGVHVASQERRIGMVFQEPLLLPHRTALSNVALAVRAAGRGERRRRALERLEQVGAGELDQRRPGELSGGQQQRVALARALAGRPRLLLLDEPFSALDRATRRRLRGLVRSVVAELGLTAVFVTHDEEELGELADRVLIAEDGELTRLTHPSRFGR